jgi:hypothetical protein
MEHRARPFEDGEMKKTPRFFILVAAPTEY